MKRGQTYPLVSALIVMLSAFSLFSDAHAQKPPVRTQGKKQPKEKAWPDTLPSEMTFGNHIFRTNYNWVSLGMGFSGHRLNATDGNISVSYSFHVRKKYFTAGLMRALELRGFFPSSYDRALYAVHAGMGAKKERPGWMMSAFAGPSYGAFYTESNKNTQTFLGLRLEGQIIRKPIFDMGIGLSMYADINTRYSTAGMRIAFILSNAYKGKVNPMYR
jgi:hypothetical protein